MIQEVGNVFLFCFTLGVDKKDGNSLIGKEGTTSGGMVMKEACERCGGRGRLFIWASNGQMERLKCPVCRGKKTVETDTLEVAEKRDRKDLETLFKEYIPNEFFRYNNYTRRTLEKEMPIPPNMRDLTVDTYLEFADTFLANLSLGVLPKKSYILTAPDKCGKKWFVYTAIKNVLKAGLTPSQLLDSKDIYVLLDKNKYDEVKAMLDVDIVFLTVGASPSKSDVIVLKIILDMCERKGVPIFVVSRMSGTFLTKYDTLLVDSLGVKATKEGELGRLEQQGIYGQTMLDMRKHLEAKR